MSKKGARKRKLKDFTDGPIQGAYPDEFLNRELSLLRFQQRVLHEAADERNPLAERIKFLGILASNLDEFFMNRVGGLKQRLSSGKVALSIDGMTPAQQLAEIRQVVLELLKAQSNCFEGSIRPALEAAKIRLVRWSDLNEAEHVSVRNYFKATIFPILTPQAVDPGRPFPFISNLSLSLALSLRHQDRDEHLFARIKIPGGMPALLRLEPPSERDEARYISMREIIRHNLESLFPGMVIMNVMTFRVTRNAELELDEYEADDLLELIEEELRERRFAKVVRLECDRDRDPWILQFLMEELGMTEEDVYDLPCEVEYADFNEMKELQVPQFRYEPWYPVTTPPLSDEEANIFSLIKSGDLIVHHPYESFSTSVERFLKAAVEDPKVLAIKMTLYRTGERSTIVPLLIRAAEQEKAVVCLIELKAHFDEARNIQWAQALEEAGAHVMYGVVGLKTHAKIVLVIRQEAEGIRCYAHIGTGNYNPQTARVYTDLGLFTCNPSVCDELVELFHFLTGRSMKRDYQKLLVAPFTMRDQFLKFIERETQLHEQKRPAEIIAKFNSLEDPVVIRALYRASQAGVPITLIVRGVCLLRPGVDGLSKTIRVLSVVGRFLEHSRIFYFRNGAEDPLDGDFFIGSADWMTRNLQRRVEVIAPLSDRLSRDRCWEILQLLVNDHRQAWELQSNGTYLQRVPRNESEQQGSHQIMMKLTRDRAKQGRPTIETDYGSIPFGIRDEDSQISKVVYLSDKQSS